MSTIDERSKVVLGDIVRFYIESGEPVGSRTLSRTSGLKLSPSSIRNIMSDLEHMGLIVQPHTSAGRVPTDAGYRFFVDTLITAGRRPSPEAAQTLASQLDSPASDKKQFLQDASRIISSMTHCMAIITAPRLSSMPIQHISFMRMSERQILVVLVTQSGLVQNAVIDTPAPVSTDDLERINRFVSERIVGRSLHDAKRHLRHLMAREMADCQRIIESLSQHQDFNMGQLYMEGLTQVMDNQRMSRIETIRQLFAAFEQKKIILELIEQCTDARGIKIFIGAENPMESMSDYSVITRTYGDSQPLGTIGVIGPKAMDYGHVVDILDIASDILARQFASAGSDQLPEKG